MCELISINIYKRNHRVMLQQRNSCNRKHTTVSWFQVLHSIYDVFVSFVILSFSVYIFLLSSVIPCLFLLLTAFYCLYPTGPYSRKQVQQNTKSEVDNFEFPVRWLVYIYVPKRQIRVNSINSELMTCVITDEVFKWRTGEDRGI